MLKDIFKTKKQKDSEAIARLNREAEENHKRHQEMIAEDLASQQKQEQEAVHTLLNAALNDKELVWLSCDALSHTFNSPALGVKIEVRTWVLDSHKYEVTFGDSLPVTITNINPVGLLVYQLYKKGESERIAALNAEREQKKQALFDLAARVKSK